MLPLTQSASPVLEMPPVPDSDLAYFANPVVRTPRPAALISVIVLNYNGAAWLERCLKSLKAQTIADEIEVLVADNASVDRSDALAADLMQGRSDWRLIRHRENFGYCAGNNEAARHAQGQYLLFLNTDTWLERDCLERLVKEARASGAAASMPQVMNYRDDFLQSGGAAGFDPFGLLCENTQCARTREIFVAFGAALCVDSKWFQSVGGFDARFFMYADEYDLCWRLWLAGGKVILAPTARLHHRGAVAVNPNGGQQIQENRTSDTKRFYANRNGLLVLLKNSQHLLLLFIPIQLAMLAMEAMVAWAVTRRWSHLRRAYIDALLDCWRLRRHIAVERKRIRSFRKHGDFWMLRFLRGRLNRWRELRRCFRFGLPKIDHR